MRAPRVLYILANGVRARFIDRDAAAEFRTLREVENRPPANIQEIARAMRHAVESPQDPRSKAERAFLASVADEMNASSDLDRYDMLVIAAPFRLISHIRNCLSGMLLKKLQTCLNKDLTKVPDRELPSHLPVLFARRANAS
jgi:protein required for attachment to host cells